jgi:hypothetical protein
LKNVRDAILFAINNERDRQIDGGHTSDRDDNLDHRELAYAAAAYALEGDGEHWPWHPQYAPLNLSASYATNLIRAGALIVAELERIHRKAEKEYVEQKAG